MASTPSNVEAAAQTATAAGPLAESTRAASLLISLAPLPPLALESLLTHLALAFPDSAPGRQNVLVATPDATHPAVSGKSFGTLRLLPYTPSALAASTPAATLFLTAADYLNTFKIAQEQQAAACLLLGPESQSLSHEALRAMAAEVLSPSSSIAADLTLPRYRISSHDGLVNSAILYPVTRALYGARPRFPLALDLGLSMRMAERLAAVAQTFLAAGQDDAILWPVAEAATANWTITEVDGGPRTLPQPVSTDLNSLLAQIAGSLFSDMNAKAAFWQRVRVTLPARVTTSAAPSPDPWPDVTPMLEAFRLAYTNLAEIWSLVLPPNTLLGLKHLSLLPPASFRMSDALWTRIVYDFALAYRLRTINRSHLLGALTPLYLAWVASHILLADSGTPPEQHIEQLATTFENDKAYLVSRWRWPDRFNP
jgi:hypothetical protein